MPLKRPQIGQRACPHTAVHEADVDVFAAPLGGDKVHVAGLFPVEVILLAVAAWPRVAPAAVEEQRDAAELLGVRQGEEVDRRPWLRGENSAVVVVIEEVPRAAVDRGRRAIGPP